MKRLGTFLLFLAIITLGCNLSTSTAPDANIKATINAGIAQTLAAQPPAKEPPTEAVVSPTDAAVPADTPGAAQCKAPKFSPEPSGFVDKITPAEGTQGANKDPVSPTDVFSNNVTIHIVAAIKNAPKSTEFKAVWIATDTQGVADCNTKIDEYTTSTNGTRNIDFSLKPDSKFPAGTYRMELYVNGTLDTVTNFSIQ
jgi:hypothetical protein